MDICAADFPFFALGNLAVRFSATTWSEHTHTHGIIKNEVYVLAAQELHLQETMRTTMMYMQNTWRI